ncbi:MAG: hypothetical protein ABI824_14620 [Acidobacteriota bacterium]
MKTLIASLLIATLGKVLADELKEWLGWLPPKLIIWAAKRFPDDLNERLSEEWLAHCNDLPGNVAKLWHSFGCALSGLRMGTDIASLFLTIVFILPCELAGLVEFFLLLSVHVLGLEKYPLSPDAERNRRLRKAAGGLQVLGLNQLWYISSDFKRGDQKDAAIEKRRSWIFSYWVGAVLIGAGDAAVLRYRRYADRLFGE